MTAIIQVREYQNLELRGETTQLNDDCAKISKEDFDFLSKLNDTANPLLKQYYKEYEKSPPQIIKWQNAEKLQIQNYVGMIQLPSGTILEILPKVRIVPDGQDEKAKLIEMIVSTLTPHLSESSTFDMDKKSLMDYIIWWFLYLMDDVFKRGIKQNYVTVQENSTFVKGKILFAQHVLHNAALQHRTFIEYEDYTPDCIENRALHSALLACVRHNNTTKARQYCHRFDGIGKINTIHDLQHWQENRSYPHYNTIKPIAEIILRGIQPFMTKGTQEIPAVLFPMEIVYEKYIAQCLQQYAADYTVHPQHNSKKLTDKNFYLQPDIVIKEKQDLNNSTILDTKWKHYTNEYGISPSDAYQMFAYSQAYDADTILLYPKNHNGEQAKDIEQQFEHGNKKHLHIHITDLSHTPEKIAEEITTHIKNT